MDARVQLVFFGEVLDGFHLDDVKRRLGQVLRLDDAKLARLFSGSRMVLKRSVEPSEAGRYKDNLAKIGARVHIEPVPALPPLAAPAAAGAPPMPVAPAAPAGPAATPELRLAEPAEEDIVCPNCGERQSKRILCRSCATDMPMGIAAKIEAENAARAARQDELLARRAMRASATLSSRSPGTFGFGLTGRMGRLQYAASNTWVLVVIYVLAVIVIQRPSIGRIIFAMLAGLVVMFMSMRLSVLRCHDCNKTGWWTLLTFIPSVNAIFGLVLSFAPGTNGENDYGEEPPPGRWLFLGIASLVLVLVFAFTIKSAMRMAQRHANDQQEDTSDTVEFDTRSNNLPAGEAQAVFNSSYASARGHKAFAVSAGGAWGWSGSAGSVRDAMQAAVSDCDTRREAYSARCVPVNVDGQWGSSRER
jgi:uncharacterized membrane protein YhaH (DUF805 family)